MAGSEVVFGTLDHVGNALTRQLGLFHAQLGQFTFLVFLRDKVSLSITKHTLSITYLVRFIVLTVSNEQNVSRHSRTPQILLPPLVFLVVSRSFRLLIVPIAIPQGIR